MTLEQKNKISKAIQGYYDLLIADLDVTYDFDWEVRETLKQEKEELLELINETIK